MAAITGGGKTHPPTLIRATISFGYLKKYFNQLVLIKKYFSQLVLINSDLFLIIILWVCVTQGWLIFKPRHGGFHEAQA